MNYSLRKVSIILLILSFVYCLYVGYLFFHDRFEGARLQYNSSHQLEVVEVEKNSSAEYAEVKKGDIILEINGRKISKEKLSPENILSWAYSLTVERNGETVSINTQETIIGYDMLFVFFIPTICYLLCLFCIFLILKSNKSEKRYSSFFLIMFLLIISMAYLSAGGVARGDILSRYFNLLTFISVPISYLHFIHQYFKETGKKFFNNKVFLLYLLPLFNIILECFFRHRLTIDMVGSINLLSFLVSMTIVIIVIIYGLIKHRFSEQAYFLKMMMFTNLIAISPFVIFYALPYLFLDDYIFPAVFVVPFLILIPLSLVYQFMANKIYNVEFLLGRLKYYGLLAIIPTIILAYVATFAHFRVDGYSAIRLASCIYLVILGVFYFKEILDFRFRLKRFSEKFNYQDSIFKFTQIIRTSMSLKQVLFELKQTILDVLLVNQTYVMEVKSDGTISLLEDDIEDQPWLPFEKEVSIAVTEIGKIVEVDRGFLIKIGERGGTSYVMLCLSILNTPRLTRDEISWLETLAFYTSVSLENVLKIGELMEHLENVKKEGPNPAWLNKLMFAIEEKQRSDLARDLHDSVLQDMISLKHQSEMFVADFEKDKVCTAEIEQRLVNMNEQMSNVIQMTRETCQELRPQLLYDLGLVKALSKLAAQHQESSSMRIRLNTERFSKVLDLDTQLNLYRIVQELLNNAVKHSKAHEVLVMLVCIKEKVVLHYEDDGIGFDQDKLYQNSSSMGLSGIRERVRALNGKLDIKTAEGKGFKVIIEMEL
ncbi:histidine kinase [Bacillus glycinifermentans]|uniref:ATP-binding protein n=1 Tax=Bacillus glycinifermentans TaxID=1664069 RepID=UPI0006536F83|nr:ATP-binding protein [Bacillus glycinifermentans]KMM57772.1 histidine kinase [Bacillus glycinifermentans]MEC0493369.1 histidine kinase [Bacillus glycinifermentans]MEC0541538.1 histidine kinase [Bacillus glycinifermentans]